MRSNAVIARNHPGLENRRPRSGRAPVEPAGEDTARSRSEPERRRRSSVCLTIHAGGRHEDGLARSPFMSPLLRTNEIANIKAFLVLIAILLMSNKNPVRSYQIELVPVSPRDARLGCVGRTGRPRNAGSMRNFGRQRPCKRPVGKVLAVSVGGARAFDYHGRPARSAIWKSPVSGRVAVRGVNLAGDDQADRQAHGGPDKAVYAYAVEDARWWESQDGRPFALRRVRREPDDRRHRRQRRARRRALGDRVGRPRGLRAARAVLAPGGPHERSDASSAASPRRCGRAPTCASSRRATSAPATRSRRREARARPHGPRRVPHLHARPRRVRAASSRCRRCRSLEALGRDMLQRARAARRRGRPRMLRGAVFLRPCPAP